MCTEVGWGPTEDVQPVGLSDGYLSLGNCFDVSLICFSRTTLRRGLGRRVCFCSFSPAVLVTQIYACDKLLSFDSNTEGYCFRPQHHYIQSQQGFNTWASSGPHPHLVNQERNSTSLFPQKPPDRYGDLKRNMLISLIWMAE